MRPLMLAALLAAAAPTLATADSLRDFLHSRGKPPLEYLLSKTDAHPIVIAGEDHWRRDDAQLIAAAVPELRLRGVALAMEMIRAASQADVDRLIHAEEWDPKLANEILRAADWPYVQYRDILHAAWAANRERMNAPPFRLLAIGLPRDFRDRKMRYDETLAQLVTEYVLGGENRRILVYCGMHHAFTRYQQVDRRWNGRALRFMDRMGNILWRSFGEDVFVIALHKPEWCGPMSDATSLSCAPFDGALDCAARTPVGFDILASPVAGLPFPANSFYALNHPMLRLIDYADGYIWTRRVDEAPLVEIIPFEEWAADLTPAQRAWWEKWKLDLECPLERRASWAQLSKWRENCQMSRGMSR